LNISLLLRCLCLNCRSTFDLFESLRNIYKNFSTEDALWIKETEKVPTNVKKPWNTFIKDAFEKLGLSEYKEFIHFG
jgi:adenylosuccinate lyase